MRRPRVVLAIATFAAASFAATGTAAAAGGHTSCRGLGSETSSEARNRLVAPEIQAFAPGAVDDLVHLVQLGGTFDGEPVPPLCTPK